MRPYVTSFLPYLGVSSFHLNKMVFIPFTQLPTPYYKLPNSLENVFIHVLSYLGCLVKCWYSKDSPVLSTIIELANNGGSCNHCGIWLACYNILVGCWCDFSWLFYASCVMTGILFALLYPSLSGAVICICYIPSYSVWYIFGASLELLLGAPSELVDPL